jgi:glycyl-tRNA synthetase beta chain
MTEQADLLFELGTEELPPLALPRLSAALVEQFAAALEAAGIAHGELVPYATPRRLAVLVRAVARQQPERRQQRRGPAWSAAYDADGNPTQAALGFARSCGVTLDELDELETPKGRWLQYAQVQSGQATADLLPEILHQVLRRLPIPKRMRWGDSEHSFVRPVHWLVLLHGQDVVDCVLFGMRAGRETRGHRFHHPQPIRLAAPEAYASVLESQGQVLADFASRRACVQAQVTAAAAELGLVAGSDDDLLDEITALNEWPVAITGRFATDYLALPTEVLVTSMQQHQKFVPVFDAQGNLQPYFIAVANIASRDPEQVRAGYERVMHPRLADAQFFWQQDGEQRLADHQSALQQVVFQEQLGTLADKTARVAVLARQIAVAIGGEVALAERAAQLSRCDLMLQMVQEFPSLQGVMGRYQALRDDEPAELAQALAEFYQPRFAGDALPQSQTGVAIALADRLDTLVGIFGIGQAPTGDKDPFALRRAALGVLRILREQAWPVSLTELIHAAREQLAARLTESDVEEQVAAFMLQRLYGLYQETGVSKPMVQAVAAVQPVTLADFEQRVQAIQVFARTSEANSLAAVHKRITQVLKKADIAAEPAIDVRQLTEPAECELFDQLQHTAQALQPLAGDYCAMLSVLAQLHPPVDTFFTQVMVMTDDLVLRQNRLALLHRAAQLFLQVADLSVLSMLVRET